MPILDGISDYIDLHFFVKPDLKCSEVKLLLYIGRLKASFANQMNNRNSPF